MGEPNESKQEKEVRERMRQMEAERQQKLEELRARGEAARMAAVAKAKEAQQVRTYQVRAGDTLGKIAAQFYGDGSRWPEIFEANKDQLKNPDLIEVGMELRIP
jgi:nucleoid-associated protein YgaU